MKEGWELYVVWSDISEYARNSKRKVQIFFHNKKSAAKLDSLHGKTYVTFLFHDFGSYFLLCQSCLCAAFHLVDLTNFLYNAHGNEKKKSRILYSLRYIDLETNLVIYRRVLTIRTHEALNLGFGNFLFGFICIQASLSFIPLARHCFEVVALWWYVSLKSSWPV